MKKEKVDFVNNPSHYTQLAKELNGMECWDVYLTLIKHKDLSPSESILWSNAFKYLWRLGDKSEEGKTQKEKNIEDTKKVIAYANKLIEEFNKNESILDR